MNYHFHKPFLFILTGFLLFSTCDEQKEEDTTPPTITITFPQNGSTVSEHVPITCMSSDNEGVEKVELWIDGVSTGVTDKTEPYSLDWNTTTYEDGSYTIIVRSYDTNGNTTDSDPITLIVDNSGSYPNPVELYPISYQDGSFIISWLQSIDDDFSSYELYESMSEDMSSNTLIYETDVKTDTTYIITGIDDDEIKYFQVVVEDIFNYESTGSIGIGSSYQKIVFESYREESNYNSEIYIMDINGIGQVNLTNHVGSDKNPLFSPDGSEIIFSSTRDGNEDIFIMDLNGTNQTNLTKNSGWNSFPRFSPDGTKVVFVSNRDGNTDIYLMNINGTNQTNLTNNEMDNRFPQFSTNGSKIVFVRYHDGNNEIYSMNIDGTNQTRLTINSGNNLYPTFSPDGSKISFISNRDGVEHIYLMNVDGSNQIKLTNNPDWDRNPQFTPDGLKIIFMSYRPDGYHSDIFLINIDGSDQILLTNDTGDNEFPVISLDGLKILFHSDKDGNHEIYLMNIDGTNQTNLTRHEGSDVFPQFQPRP